MNNGKEETMFNNDVDFGQRFEITKESVGAGRTSIGKRPNGLGCNILIMCNKILPL